MTDPAPAPVPPSRTAVLLVNLGTPDAPSAKALRRYLGEFLADRRVVELPRAVWWPLLHGLILPLRAPRSAAVYRTIWSEQGSPLRALSQSLQAAVAAQIEPRARVLLAMRYGEPSVATQLEHLREDGLDRLLVLPLYPQYSATTTASVLDAVTRTLQGWRHWPELRTINDYHQDEGWLDAVATSIREHRASTGSNAHLLFSFHGIPQAYADRGDPYPQHCEASARAISARLGLQPEQWSFSYQSRFGRGAWLEPATDARVRELARSGIRELDVVCPGFAVDCLETLEEIAMQNAGFFREAGGESLRYIPALNDSQAHANALAKLIERHLSGWLPAPINPARQAASAAGA